MCRMFVLEIILFFILTADSQFVYQSSKQQQQQQFTANEFNSCFSQLTGPVEEYCPTVENIHGFNIELFHDLISELVKRPYFRYYQVRMVNTRSYSFKFQISMYTCLCFVCHKWHEWRILTSRSSYN